MRLIAILATLLVTCATSWADVTFRASAPQSVEAGRQFRVEYTLTDRGSDIKADLTGHGFEVLYGPSTSESSSIQIINGQMSQEVRTTYSYVLVADKEGTYTLPAATARDKAGHTYTSQTLTIRVLPADTQSQQGGQAQQRPQQGQSQQGVSKDDCHLVMDLSRTSAYQGEAIVATLKLYWRNHQMGNPTDVKLPDFEGFTVQEIDNSNAQASLEHYRGSNYQMYPLAKWLLFPSRTGQITIPSAQLTAQLQVVTTRRSGGFFDWPMEYTQQVAVPLTSSSRTIEVKNLPAGRPDSYMNAVGDFRISSSLSANQGQTNQAILYRLVIEGVGNLKYVTEPQPEFPSDFEVFDPKVDLNVNTTSQGVSGKKVIEYTLIPRHAGQYNIPAVAFSYFDTKANSYRTLMTEAHSISITKDEGSSSQGGQMVDFSGSNQERLKVLGSDIRYLHAVDATSLLSAAEPYYGSMGYWMWFILPLLAFVAVVIIYRRRLRLNADVMGTRTRRAGKVAERRLKAAALALKASDQAAFYQAIHQAILGYASDKLRIPLSQLSADNVAQQLREHGASDPLIDEVCKVLQTCEFARYAPSGTASAMDELYAQTSQLISRLEGELKHARHAANNIKSAMILLVMLFMSGLMPMMATAQETTVSDVTSNPLASVEQQLQMAQQAYDSAQYAQTIELYEAILSQKGGNDDLHYNLAGAYYKQRLYARAVLHYERCLLLNPSHADARANLEMARMQCVDKIETIQPPIFVVWSNVVRDLCSANTWSVWSIILFILFLGLVAVYFFINRLWMRKVGFYGALVVLVFSMICMSFAHQQTERLTHRDQAIIMAPSVVVRSSPAESGTQLFTIHEGLSVRVRSTLGDWSEIELSDGNVGWMLSEGLEII